MRKKSVYPFVFTRSAKIVMCPTVVNCVTLIPVITSEVTRPKGGISGHSIKKTTHRNALPSPGHIVIYNASWVSFFPSSVKNILKSPKNMTTPL